MASKTRLLLSIGNVLFRGEPRAASRDDRGPAQGLGNGVVAGLAKGLATQKSPGGKE